MHLRPLQSQAGFTLVEVMVTVFVVAIGVLAAAALQTVSKKAAVDALQRTTATVVAQDMIERMRANPLAIGSYAELIGSAPADPGCGAASSCTGAALVAYDKFQWWQNLDGTAEQIAVASGTENSGGLREPRGCIRVTGNLVEVVVVWRGMSKIAQGAETGDVDDPTGDTCFANQYEFSGNESYRRVLRIRANIA